MKSESNSILTSHMINAEELGRMVLGVNTTASWRLNLPIILLSPPRVPAHPSVGVESA